MQARPQSTSAAPLFTSTFSLSSSSPQQIDRDFDPGPAGDLHAAGRQPVLDGTVAEGAGLAHDAGNLLQALGLYSQLLQRPGVLRPEHTHYATELSHLAERSSAMIRRLLQGLTTQEGPAPAPGAVPSSHSRSTARSTPPCTGPHQVRSVFQGTPVTPAPASPYCANPAQTLHDQAALLQRLAAPWAMISISTQDRLPGLDFNAEILERITVNLVLNAAEALRGDSGASGPRRSLHTVETVTAEGAAPQTAHTSPAATHAGRIRVSLRMAGGRLRLSVEDNGPGIPAGTAAAFLRPSPLPPGTSRGLGHRIVHELATATGGQLSVQTRPGGGTIFSLDWSVRTMKVSGSSPIGRPDSAALRLVAAPNARVASPISPARGASTAFSAGNRAVFGGFEAC